MGGEDAESDRRERVLEYLRAHGARERTLALSAGLLARRLGCPERLVRRSLQALEDEGAVERRRLKAPSGRPLGSSYAVAGERGGGQEPNESESENESED